MSERLVWTYLEAGRASDRVGMKLITFRFAVQVAIDLLMQHRLLVSEWPFRTTVGFMTHVVGKSLSFVSVRFQWKSVLLQFKVTIKSF